MTAITLLTSAKGVSDTHMAWAKAFGPVKRLSETAVEVAGEIAIEPPAGLDINTVTRSPKKLFIADMDSTMIEVECIDELADYAGVKPQVSEITERAMQGELNFEAALKERVSLLKGLTVATLQECYNQRITFSPGAHALIAGLHAAGIATALVSGGFTFFSERVARELGFQSHQANTLEVEDGHLTGRVTLPILGREAKLAALHAQCQTLGCTPAESVAIGDGANDLAMIGAAGLGIAYKAKPAVAAEADAGLNHSDLTAVLALI